MNSFNLQWNGNKWTHNIVYSAFPSFQWIFRRIHHYQNEFFMYSNVTVVPFHGNSMPVVLNRCCVSSRFITSLTSDILCSITVMLNTQVLCDLYITFSCNTNNEGLFFIPCWTTSYQTAGARFEMRINQKLENSAITIVFTKDQYVPESKTRRFYFNFINEIFWLVEYKVEFEVNKSI